MMAESGHAGDYREKAARLRDLARQTRFPECRAELLALAESFERLAEQVEAWNHGVAAERWS